LVLSNKDIKIGGHTFSLKAQDNNDMLEIYVEYLNLKLKEVNKGSNEVTIKSVILTALNLTEELFHERDKHKVLLKQIRLRAQNIKDFMEIKIIEK
jgi:cell division protein ZapA (FtsZ GTPase activity inhibitor)